MTFASRLRWAAVIRDVLDSPFDFPEDLLELFGVEACWESDSLFPALKSLKGEAPSSGRLRLRESRLSPRGLDTVGEGDGFFWRHGLPFAMVPFVGDILVPFTGVDVSSIARRCYSTSGQSSA